MAIITIPAIKTPAMSMQLLRGDTPLEFFDGSEVVVQHDKARWVLSFPLIVEKIGPTRAWQAALVQLAKLTNTFQLTPPAWVPGVTYTGSPILVAGAGQLGLSLNCDTTPLENTVPVSLKGDFISVNTEFKMLTADATTDAAGLVTFNFEPALRNAPANNAVVEVTAPLVTVRLVNPSAEWSVGLPDFYDIQIDCIEAFGP